MLVAALLSIMMLVLMSSTNNLAEAKRVYGTTTLVSGRVNQIAKFSFRPGGAAEVTGTLEFRGPEPRGAVYLFMDTEWGKLNSLSPSKL